MKSFGMDKYTSNFTTNGYDLSAIRYANAADLTAIQISKPSHRKKIGNHITDLRKKMPASPASDKLPRSVEEWLRLLSLSEYCSVFATNKVDSVEQLIHTTWEDLQVHLPVCPSHLVNC